MNFTKGALVWAKSRLGEKLACVCVCEVINHTGTSAGDRDATARQNGLARSVAMVPNVTQMGWSEGRGRSQVSTCLR